MKPRPFTSYDKRTVALLKSFGPYDRRIIGGLVRMLDRFPPPVPNSMVAAGQHADAGQRPRRAARGVIAQRG